MMHTLCGYLPRRVCFFVVISKKEEEAMKLVGELKDKVEKAENQEEAKKIIEKAGMELTDDELDQVAGGVFVHWPRT
jgi:hypothetical protein